MKRIFLVLSVFGISAIAQVFGQPFFIPSDGLYAAQGETLVAIDETPVFMNTLIHLGVDSRNSSVYFAADTNGDGIIDGSEERLFPYVVQEMGLNMKGEDRGVQGVVIDPYNSEKELLVFHYYDNSIMGNVWLMWYGTTLHEAFLLSLVARRSEPVESLRFKLEYAGIYP